MSTHNLHSEPSHGHERHIHRIGSVSRLSGVPVSTLRMWESRYAAFTPGKTGGQHRLYTDDDVVRARLLRQLTEAGHSIGGIAVAPAPQLQEMLSRSRAASARARRETASRLSIAVVGGALAARLTSSQVAQRIDGAILDMQSVAMSVDEALGASLPEAPVDMLLVRLSAVQPPDVARLAHLRSAWGARHGVLLYNFGAQPTLKALREDGFILRREPIDDNDLAELVRSVVWARSGGAAPEGGEAAAAIPARRFSDAELIEVGSRSTNMLCECPRHLSDIIAQLASFEDYSAACLNDSEEDARIHAQLRSTAGSARAMFENALDLVLAHDARVTTRGQG